MKKQVLFILGLILIAGFAQAQPYYYLTYPSGSGNPGGINTEIDNIVDNAPGWSKIINGGQTQGIYSATQTVPFTFMFNGAPVAGFKASSTGYITFDVLAAGNPDIFSEALPSPKIPNSSVVIWGMNANGANDAVVMKTFGTAPNRQLWVRFMSMSTPGNTTSYTYWSIVLEETTNNIYVVEQYGGPAGYVSPNHSIGVQIDGSTAVSVSGSPNIKHPGTGNASTAADNKYYAFIYGTQYPYDLTAYENTTTNTVKVNTGINFTGKIRNIGTENVSSMTLNYSIDNSPPVTADINGIAIVASGGGYSYTHPTTWTPSVAGVQHTIEVWATNINGNADQNTANDKITFKVVVSEGITTTRNVLIDEGSGAWCQHCPDALVYLNQIRDAFGERVIVASHHQGNTPTSDRWTNDESDKIHAAYNVGYPYATVDRKLFAGQSSVGLSRSGGTWNTRFAERVDAPTPVEVSITNKNWNPDTRVITFTVEAKFVDYAAGELRIGAYIIEDDVRGVGQGYDQIISSVYTTNSSHPFYQFNNPMVGYIHPDVVLNVPSGAFGSPNSIDDDLIMKGATYSKTYTYELPAAPKFNVPSTSDFEPKGEIVGFHKAADIKLIGWVARYDEKDLNNREILNAFEEPLFNFANTVNNINNNQFGISNVYPNPTSGYTSVSFTLPNSSTVNVSIVNSIGQTVKDVRNDNFAAGDHKIVFNSSDLENGVYFVKVEGTNGESALKKFVVIK